MRRHRSPISNGLAPISMVPDRQPHRVRARRFDARFRHPRIGIAFAHARDAAVGVDDDDEAVLRRRSEAYIVVGREQHVAVDPRDFQSRRRCVEYGRDRLDGHGRREDETGRREGRKLMPCMRSGAQSKTKPVLPGTGFAGFGSKCRYAVERRDMTPQTKSTTIAPTMAPIRPAPSPGEYHPSAWPR